VEDTDLPGKVTRRLSAMYGFNRIGSDSTATCCGKAGTLSAMPRRFGDNLCSGWIESYGNIKSFGTSINRPSIAEVIDCRVRLVR